MSFVGPYVMDMGDQEHWAFMEKCDRLAFMLSNVIDRLMHYIFQGLVTDREYWEPLIKALNHAVMIKDYLTSHCSNLITIAEDFLAQYMQWLSEMEGQLN